MPRPLPRVPTLLSLAALLLASSAGALNFHTTATTRVRGNCLTEVEADDDGGTFIDSAIAETTALGPINTACAPSYVPANWVGTADASATLSTGLLEVFASGENSQATATLFPNGSPLNLDVRASASFSDTFRLVPPAGYSGPNPRIDVVLTMTSSVSFGPGPAGSNAAHLNWYLETSSFNVPNLRTNRCNEAGSISVTQPCFFLGGTNVDPIVHRLTIPLANPEISLSAQLNATVSNNGTADASTTGTLSLVLPEGFSIESDSEVLLVPEPGSTFLLGSSVLALVLVHSGRRRPL